MALALTRHTRTRPVPSRGPVLFLVVLFTVGLTACWTEAAPDPLIAAPGPGCWMLHGGAVGQEGIWAFEVGADGGSSRSSRGGPAPAGPAWTDAELEMVSYLASRRADAQVLAVRNALDRRVSRAEATFHLQTLRTKLLNAAPC